MVWAVKYTSESEERAYIKIINKVQVAFVQKILTKLLRLKK